MKTRTGRGSMLHTKLVLNKSPVRLKQPMDSQANHLGSSLWVLFKGAVVIWLLTITIPTSTNNIKHDPLVFVISAIGPLAPVKKSKYTNYAASRNLVPEQLIDNLTCINSITIPVTHEPVC